MDNGVFEGVQEAAQRAMQQMLQPNREYLDVRFYHEPTLNEAKTKESGRYVYEDIEWVEIRVPGEPDIRRRPVKEADRTRFAEKYKLFKVDDTQEKADGFPLREWTLVTASQRKELEHYGIRSVEQLANVSDTALRQVGQYMALRQRAKDWLVAMKDSSVLVRLRTENEELKTRLSALEETVRIQAADIAVARASGGALPSAVPDGRVALLEKQMADLAASMTAPRRRGRPPGSKNKPKDPVPEE